MLNMLGALRTPDEDFDIEESRECSTIKAACAKLLSQDFAAHVHCSDDLIKDSKILFTAGESTDFDAEKCYVPADFCKTLVLLLMFRGVFRTRFKEVFTSVKSARDYNTYYLCSVAAAPCVFDFEVVYVIDQKDCLRSLCFNRGSKEYRVDFTEKGYPNTFTYENGYVPYDYTRLLREMRALY